MKTKVLLFILFLGLTQICLKAQTNISGIISSNTIWSIDNSPYLVTGNILVSSGIELTIEPGVIVDFQGPYYLEVNGILNAIGTVNDSIYFQGDSWGTNFKGINLNEPGSLIKYAVIMNADNYEAKIWINGSKIENSHIRNINSGILVLNGGEINRCKIYDIGYSAISMGFNSIVYGNEIYNCSGDRVVEIGPSGGTFSNNRLYNLTSTIGIEAAGGIIENNTIGGSFGNHGNTGILIGYEEVICRHNNIGGFSTNIAIAGNTPTINYNNFFGLLDVDAGDRNVFITNDDHYMGHGLFNHYDSLRTPVKMENNYWGNVINDQMDESIHDYNDDFSVFGVVDYSPELIFPDTTAPPLPVQNVSIESIWPDSVNVVWDKSPIGDLKGYKIYFDTDSNNYVYDSYANQIDVGMDTSYVIKNLEAGKEYYITVTCYDNSGDESWYSEEIKVTHNPSPLIHAIHDTITFDTTFMNETLESELIIVNTGTDTLQIDSVKFDISQFTGSIDSTSIALADSAIVSLTFQPTTFGDINGTLTIYSNAVNAPEKTIQLIANGDYPEKPEIKSIQDVMDDQGGQVRITFSRSKYDGLDNTYQIDNYSVWRFENDSQWDAIGMFNAVQDSVYYYVAPTLCDSTIQGNCLSTFKVSAHTTNPDIFYYSDTLSGYSVDNIAPEAPQGLKSAIVANGVQLDWESNDEEDFQYYKIYRSDQPITDLSYSEIDSFTTVDTTYLDTEVEVDNQYYYRLVAYDHAGNRSDLSNEINLEFTGIGDSQILDKFNMGQNQPNPFVNSTTIQYTIPNHSFVNISVYSLLGKKLTTLVNEDKVSGSYSFEWSPDDIKPGIYFYILKAQDVVITRKLIVLEEL